MEDTIYAEDGRPLYVNNEIIIKFNPLIMNLNVVDDTNFISGKVSDFIDSTILQLIIDSGNYNQSLADLEVKKIYPWLTSQVTTSTTRIGTTIEMPEFWSTLLISWNPFTTGYSMIDAIDTFNAMYPVIEFADKNYLAELHVLPNDALFALGEQPGIHPTVTVPGADINIDPAWDLSVGKDNIRVGVVDLGINWDHEDYSEDNSGTFQKSRVKGGKDYVNGVQIDLEPEFDDHGHGSACAGIIGAIRNNDRGVAGIAGGDGANSEWGVELYALKVGTANIIISMAHCVSAITQGATSVSDGGYGLHVINNSYGFPGVATPVLEDPIKFAFRNNCLNVASMGNKSSSNPAFPAGYRDELVLTVGATDKTGERASFSNFDNDIDVMAPGTEIMFATTDAKNNSTYNFQDDGTSFAAPHVAGLAALMCSNINQPSSAPNNLAPEDIENIIQKNTLDLDAPGYDNKTGHGRIDAGATMEALEMPRFEVKHYSNSVASSSAVKTHSDVNINFWRGIYPSLPTGDYLCDAYKITTTINFTTQPGRTIIDVWPRNSTSDLWWVENNIVKISAPNSPLISWNQNSAVMEGYIIHMKRNSTSGQTVNEWFPHDLNGNSTLALTTYSDDQATTSTRNVYMNTGNVAIAPNPSNGNFKLYFTLIKAQDLKLSIFDLQGKKIMSKELGLINVGQTITEVNLGQNIIPGVYFVELSNQDGRYAQRIIIQ